MTPVAGDAVFAGTVVVGVVIWGIGWWVRRRHDDPGVEGLWAFSALVGAAAVVAGASGLSVVDRTDSLAFDDPSTLGVWYLALVTILYLAPIPWGTFVLNYTGMSRDLELSTGRRAVLGGTIASVPLFAWLEFGTAAVGSPEVPALLAVVLVAVRMAATTFSLTVFLSTVGVLVYSTYVYGHLRTEQGVSLAIAASGPVPLLWLSSRLLGSPEPGVTVLGFATVLAAFVVCAAGMALAVARYGAFESTPAAGAVGRDALIEVIDDVVVVLDGGDRVSEVNPAAVDRLQDSAADPLGKPVEDVLGVGVDRLRSTGTIELPTADGRRQFDPQVSEVTDQQGRWFATVITLRDVTRREIREQRLEVLNRVLRHNMRNKLSIVKGTADDIARDDPRPALDRLDRAADELMELGEQARRIERLMREDHPPEVPVELTTIVEDVVGDVAARYPQVGFETEVDADLVLRGDEALLRHLLANLVENGAEHNTADSPRVRVTVSVRSPGSTPVRIAVEDNGPGIPRRERDVIRDGTETPLDHASGLGLWSANWCARRLGGSLSFDTSRADGARVVVDLPESSAAHFLEVDPGRRSTGRASGD